MRMQDEDENWTPSNVVSLNDEDIEIVLDTAGPHEIVDMCESVRIAAHHGMKFENKLTLSFEDFAEIELEAGRFVRFLGTKTEKFYSADDESGDNGEGLAALKELAKLLQSEDE